MAPIHSSFRKRLLRVLSVVIALGLGILAIDTWIVKRGEPDLAQRRAALAAEFGFTEADAAARARLGGLFAPFAEAAGGGGAPDPVLVREDETHALWLFEYPAGAVAWRRYGRPNSRLDVPLFGILVEDKRGRAWPAWSSSDTNAAAALPEAAARRLAGWEGYRVAKQGGVLLAHTMIGEWALSQVIKLRQSPEFFPGLYNSAMKVDAQRVLDFVNALDPDLAPLPRFDRSLAPVLPPFTQPRPAISSRLTEIQKEIEAKRAEDAARMEQQRAELRAKFEADMQRAREKMRAPGGESKPSP